MSITSTEIREVGFAHSLRGYDIEQVDAFLEKAAVGVEELAAQVEALKARAAEAEVKAAEALAAAAKAEQEAQEAPAPEPAPAVRTTPPAVDSEELERANSRAADAEATLAETQARLREAERQVRNLEAKAESLEKELSEKESRDKIISEAFIAAQQSAENLKEEARAEGERIYRESEAKARELIREALTKKQQVLTEIDTLEASCAKFRKDYKKMIEHFAADAESEFSDIKPPLIPDSIVNELMPDPDTLGKAVEAAPAAQPAVTAIPEEKIPAFETQAIPALPIEDENVSGQTFADDGLDVEEI